MRKFYFELNFECNYYNPDRYAFKIYKRSPSKLYIQLSSNRAFHKILYVSMNVILNLVIKRILSIFGFMYCSPDNHS